MTANADYYTTINAAVGMLRAGDIVNTKRALSQLGHYPVPPERGIDDWAIAPKHSRSPPYRQGGIPLVAASEELVFRAAPMLVWGRRHALWWVIGSSLAFAAIHWGLGPRSMVPALATGLVFAAALARTGSILPAAVAHVLTNWVEFTLPQLMSALH